MRYCVGASRYKTVEECRYTCNAATLSININANLLPTPYSIANAYSRKQVYDCKQPYSRKQVYDCKQHKAKKCFYCPLILAIKLLHFATLIYIYLIVVQQFVITTIKQALYYNYIAIAMYCELSIAPLYVKIYIIANGRDGSR